MASRPDATLVAHRAKELAQGLGIDLRALAHDTALMAYLLDPGEGKYALEDLAARTDQLLTCYIWADDIGPDGKLRRTSSDMFFAEVRPFDEIFREGESMEGGGGRQGGGQAQKLAELQKQIINATWKLQRGRSAGPAALTPYE